MTRQEKQGQKQIPFEDDKTRKAKPRRVAGACYLTLYII
jgi:hypothetical protein